MCEIKGKSTASGVRDTIHKKLYKKLIISLYSNSLYHVIFNGKNIKHVREITSKNM